MEGPWLLNPRKEPFKGDIHNKFPRDRCIPAKSSALYFGLTSFWSKKGRIKNFGPTVRFPKLGMFIIKTMTAENEDPGH